jgi:hypothetical protein
MAGTKWKAVVEGVQRIIRVLRPLDTVTCLTFNNKVDVVRAFDFAQCTAIMSALRQA